MTAAGEGSPRENVYRVPDEEAPTFLVQQPTSPDLHVPSSAKSGSLEPTRGLTAVINVDTESDAHSQRSGPPPPPPPRPPPPKQPSRSVAQALHDTVTGAVRALNGFGRGRRYSDVSAPRATEDSHRRIHDERAIALDKVDKMIAAARVLLPDSQLMRLWDAALLLATLIQVIASPLLLVDSFTLKGPLLLLFLLLSALYALDAFIRVNTAHLNPNDELCQDRSVIRSLFMRKWAVVDVLSILPFDCVLSWLDVSGWPIKIAHLARMLRLCHVRNLFQLSNPGAIDPAYVNFYFNVVPVVTFTFWFVIAVHILVVAKLALADTTHYDPVTESQMYRDSLHDRRYDYCLFWVWNLLTTSPAPLTLNTYAQRVLCFFLMCSGIVFQGVIVGQVSLMLLKSGVQQHNEAKMRTTLEIVKHYHLPSALQQEVLSMQWHSLRSSLNFFSNSGSIFDRLPALMRNEINIYIKIDFITKCSMFAEARHQTKAMLANSLRREFREPGEMVIEFGDVGAKMYFVLHGFCDVLVPNVGSVAVLRRGDFFGEVALLSDTPRTADIKTLTYCDFFVLHRAEFQDLIGDDVHFRLHLIERMRVHLRKDKTKAQQRWQTVRNVFRALGARGVEADDGLARRETNLAHRKSSRFSRKSMRSCASADSDDSKDAEDLVHKLAARQTASERKSADTVKKMLQAARQRRASRGPALCVAPKQQSFTPRLPAAAATAPTEGAAEQQQPRVAGLMRKLRTSVGMPEPTSPKGGHTQAQPSAERSMSISVGAPPGMSGIVRAAAKASAVVASPTSPSQAKATFGGDDGGDLDGMSSDAKVTLCVKKLDSLGMSLRLLHAAVSRQGAALEEVVERQDVLADQWQSAADSQNVNFSALQEDVAALLDLVGVLADGQTAAARAGSVQHIGSAPTADMTPGWENRPTYDQFASLL
eukprot:TRINITY_DN2670_c5_g1_i1.p1 TRINITY_DN2670_c5_g1~~TRINITY_DN2670_c5_g1_i1.p1  ORF type:complete len:941 (+),score=314.63 TRINITY_DN2670_c5_g1_i1:34-2823(+)